MVVVGRRRRGPFHQGRVVEVVEVEVVDCPFRPYPEVVEAEEAGEAEAEVVEEEAVVVEAEVERLPLLLYRVPLLETVVLVTSAGYRWRQQVWSCLSPRNASKVARPANRHRVGGIHQWTT